MIQASARHAPYDPADSSRSTDPVTVDTGVIPLSSMNNPTKGVLGIGHVMFIYLGLHLEELPQLMQFITIARDYNRKRTADVAERLRKWAESQPLDELMASPLVEIVSPDAHQLVLSRSKIEKGHRKGRK